MSYILDALRKSEQERGSPDAPGWQTDHSFHHTEPTRQQLFAIYVLSGILVILVIGVMIYWFSQQPDSNLQTDVLTESNAAASPILAQTEPDQKLNTNNVSSHNPHKTTFKQFQTEQNLASGSKSPTVLNEKTNTNAGVKSNPPQAKSVDSEPQKTPRVVFSSEPLDAGVQQILPQEVEVERAPKIFDGRSPEPGKIMNVADLPEGLRRTMPPIIFSGHVYSSSDQQSSVMVNGQKVREGQAIAPDLVVYKITNNGAVFNYKGWLFSLSALQDWSFSN